MEKRKARLKPMIGGYAEQDKEEATPTSTPVRSRTAKIMMIALLLILAGFGTIYALHIRVLHAPGTGILVSTPVLKKLTQAEMQGVVSTSVLPKETYIGPMTCQNMSRELLEKHARNNTVMITFTSKKMFKIYGATWLGNVRKAGIDYWYLVVACEQTARYVHKVGAHNCFMAEEMEITDLYADYKWGSKTWSLHTWQKVLTVRHVAQLGFNVIHSDLDIVWFRDPYPYFMQEYTIADYMVSLDPMTTQNPIGDGGPEVQVTAFHYMNTGLYFLRATPGGLALINTWYDIRKQMQNKGMHDQDGLNKYLTTNGEKVDRSARITYVVDGKTKMAQLPATQFQNGYSHCINKLHKVHGLEPYAAHMTWIWGENFGKVNRLREFMYFEDKPSYYLGDDGRGEADFISVDIPHFETPEDFNDWRDIVNDTEKMVQTHITNVEKQLSVLYYAFAIAFALKRTLIMPKIQCWCIQNWFENPLCRLPGELSTKFPMDCPADYLFKMDHLKQLNIDGHHLQTREYSFLDNYRTPDVVKVNPLVVTASGQVSNTSLQVTLPKGSKDEDIAAQLSKYKNSKRIHFTNPVELFGGFVDSRIGLVFGSEISKLPVVWCCRPDVLIKARGLPGKVPLRMIPKVN